MTGREASKILLTGKDGMVSLNLFYTGKQVLGPTSLLQTTGEAHKRLRRLIAEPLSVDGLKKYFHFINTLAIETLDQWSGRKVLVLEEASTVKFFIILSKGGNPTCVVYGDATNFFILVFTSAVHSQSNRQHDNELRTHRRRTGKVSIKF